MKKTTFLIFILFIISSCKKSEGEGGNSTITGKVFAIDMDNKFEDTLGQFYSGKEDVYIIYGEDDIYGDKTETNYDGSFQFKYLYPGNYKVFCYSKDTAGTNQLLYVVKEVSITDKKQTVTTEDFVIIK